MNILIIEDDIALNNGIALALKDKGYKFLQAHKLSQGWQMLKSNAVDLVILDINLPDGNGLDLCKEVRQTNQVPIIVLTAKDLEIDIVSAFELGADDYITKPFSLMILRSRVEAVLRRTAKRSINYFIMEDYVFDFDNMVFSKGGTEITLSKTEQKLLDLLIQNAGNTVSREILIDKIWCHGGEFVDENTLSVAINRLRNKLAAQDYILTVYGIGYTWVIKK